METSLTDVVILELSYAEICTLLESGTVQPDSLLHKKLRDARDVFLRMPKQYGAGLKRVVHEAE